MGDLEIKRAMFSDTEFTVRAMTTAGREFFAARIGQGAVEIMLPKSNGGELVAAAEAAGLSVLWL